MRYNAISIGKQPVIILVGSILSMVISIFLSTAFAPQVLMDDMPGGLYRSDGLLDSPGNAYGFLAPEVSKDGTTYSWTDSHATLTFPYAANLGRYVHVSLRLASKSSIGQSPPGVTLSL